MSQTVITKAFVEWKAQQAADNQPVTLDEFIFAFVPDLDVTKPIDNTEAIPTDKIVYRQAVSKTGVVNANAVVYSVTMGADVGDFDFNWIGLTNKASGTLAMIIHAPTQRKIQNSSGQQGNVLVRSMLMEYSGAQASTNITTPAETWQIDFTARLAGMDETVRLAALDIYGAGAFFDNGFLVAKTGTQYFVTKGLGYVGGLRAALAENQNVAVSAKPTKVWADISYQGTLTSAYKTAIAFTVADTMENHTTEGVAHYVFALASIDAAGVITDLRPQGTLDEQTASNALKKHEQSRNHPDGSLTDKGFIQLSSSVTSDSETLAATSKAVMLANDNADSRLKAESNLSDLNDKAKGRDNLGLGKLAVKDTLGPSDVGALSVNGGELKGEVWTETASNYRIISANKGAFSRFDGNDYYVMFTKEGDPNGSWSDLRPLKLNFSSGDMETNHHFRAGGDIKAGLNIVAGVNVYSAGGASWMATDGNIYGTCWGGYLNNWVNGKTSETQNNAINWAYSNCVQDIRLGSSSEFQERGNNERMGGGVMTSFKDAGSSNYWIRLRPLQKAVGGAWYTVAYA